MSFSPAWLALREPADNAARSKDVLAACSSFFARCDAINICDLGAGTGATVRALADLLPVRQYWTLVDYDAANLAAAKDVLAAWSGSVETKGDALVLKRGSRTIEVHTRQHDFANDLHCWPGDTQLVTASALLDLVSADWIARFVGALAANRTPLLSLLTADGLLVPEPAHILDGDIIAAFHAHQTGDKGFGPSAGCQAAALLEGILREAGYILTADDSPWRLSPSELLQATLDGMAGAIRETRMMNEDDVARWRAQARGLTKLVVGHRDVFARFT